MAENVVGFEELQALVIKKLTKEGIKQTHAEITANVLVHANLRGVDSHGVLRTEHYVKRIKEGGLNKDPQFSIKDTGPCTAVFDGDDGLGHVVAKEAMDYAIKLAARNGVGMVGVINSSHCGALSYFVEQAAEKNMIGMAMTHTDKAVVPFGGAEPYFGTNPIAYGFPTNKGEPIILDMATSNVALGKILHAREAKSEIPNNWGVDGDGNPTTDPDAVKYLLPFGGPKGYGLAMVIDIFSGLLTGSAFGKNIVPMYGDYDKKRKLGHFVCALNIEAFTNESIFLENMDQMVQQIHEVKPAPGFEKVLVPGEPEQMKKKSRLETGIPVTENVYRYLVND